MSMYKKITSWYLSLSMTKQLIITLLFNCIIWCISSQAKNVLWEDGSKSIASILFDGIWIGIFMTLLFNWTKIKVAFNYKGKESTN